MRQEGIVVFLRTCSCFPILPDSNSPTVAHSKFVMQRLVKLNLTAIDDKPNREKVCNPNLIRTSGKNGDVAKPQGRQGRPRYSESKPHELLSWNGYLFPLGAM